MTPHRMRIARKPRSFGHPCAAPLRAVLLTIDAARRSGVAIYVGGRLHHYEEVNPLEAPQRRRVVRDASTMAEVRGLPLGCVIEVPFGGHANAALTLTAVVALWRDAWIGHGHAPARMLDYTANEWRRALFGTAGMPRAEARRMEAVLAHQVAKRDMPSARHYTIGSDAAAAICIGEVATRSSVVAQALGLPTTTDRRHTV